MTLLKNQPEQEYRDAPGLNISKLKLMDISPLAFRRYRPTSKAFPLGKAAHAAILEPEAFNLRYTVLPEEFSRRTGKAYQEWADNDGREVLLRAEYETALACASSAQRSRAVRRHLEHADTELSIFTTIRGVPVKCRLDWAGPEGLGDLKTVQDMRLRNFFRQCVSLDYLAQFAFYSDAYESETGTKAPWHSGVVEKSVPHDIAVVSFAAHDLEQGRKRYNEWLDRYIECMSRDVWPGVSGEDDAEIPFEMPIWAVSDEIEGEVE